MLFGYSSHSRWLSCSRRWFAEYPPPLHFTPYALHFTAYTLRLTRVFPPSVMCTAVARRVSRVSVSIRVHPWAVYLRHLLCFASVWQYSRLFPFAPVAVLCSWFPSQVNPCLYTLHFTPYTKNNHQKCIFLWPYDRFCQFGVVPLQKILKKYNYEQQQSNYRLSNCRQSNTN